MMLPREKPTRALTPQELLSWGSSLVAPYPALSPQAQDASQAAHLSSDDLCTSLVFPLAMAVGSTASKWARVVPTASPPVGAAVLGLGGRAFSLVREKWLLGSLGADLWAELKPSSAPCARWCHRGRRKPRSSSSFHQPPGEPWDPKGKEIPHLPPALSGDKPPSTSRAQHEGPHAARGSAVPAQGVKALPQRPGLRPPSTVRSAMKSQL